MSLEGTKEIPTFPGNYPVQTHVQPLQLEVSTNISLEGTQDIPTFPGNSCFSFVSAGDKGDSEKHRVSAKEEASYLIFYKNRGLTYLSATQEKTFIKRNCKVGFFFSNSVV